MADGGAELTFRKGIYICSQDWVVCQDVLRAERDTFRLVNDPGVKCVFGWTEVNDNELNVSGGAVRIHSVGVREERIFVKMILTDIENTRVRLIVKGPLSVTVV